MLSINNKIFDTVMSIEAKELRDGVIDRCMKYGANKYKPGELEQKIIESYNPIVWERAVLFGYANELLDGVDRKTSSAYFRHKDKADKATPPWQIGSVSGNKYKHIDWLNVAKFEYDDSWFLSSVKFPRKDGNILPSAFDNLRPQFTEMYKLFTSWLIADFNHKTALNIFWYSRDYSIDFIHTCINMVNDKSKRSIEYLSAIVNKEFAIMKHDLMERKELTDDSKKTFDMILQTMSDKGGQVNWDEIDKDLETNLNNTEEFRKVKLS